MATKAQITANRNNAQESTGPKTTEGKATVSLNAIKHGLTAKKYLIPGEEHLDFNLYHYEMIKELDPVSPMESMLANRIVNLSWRLERAARIQNETIHALCVPKPISGSDKYFNAKHADYAGEYKSDVDQASPLGRSIIKDFSDERVLDRLMMYERRIEASLYKTMRELQKLTLIRKSARSPRNNQSSIMQNKPNFPNAESNLTSYAHNSYEQNPPVPGEAKQTQPNANKPNLTPKTAPQNPPHRRSQPLPNPNRRSHRAGNQIRS